MSRFEVGNKVPAFSLKDAEGKSHKLSDFSGKQVILYFYPAAMTPGCTKQACDFRDNLNSLKSAGYTVIGISPDSPEKLKQFIEYEKLNFLLLSDPEHKYMEKVGAWGEKNLYGKIVTGVIRSTLIVNGKGMVTHAMYGVKATGHVAKLHKDLGI